MRAFVEGYGCSLNRADTEQLKSFLLGRGFSLANRPGDAGLIVINTCAVKEQTETRMLKRIRELNAVAERKKSVLVVFGCLPKINPNAVSAISPKIVQTGPSLEELASFLRLPLQGSLPVPAAARISDAISIIPIATGCLGSCSYCAVKNARGGLKSCPVNKLEKRFSSAVKEAPEVWLTAQDCGCYGLDIGTGLVGLLEALLRNKGDFRVRIGMLNPGHLKSFLPEYLSLFSDERLYRFFHVPVQSGSDQVLKRMNRNYTRADFLRIVKAIRKRFPLASISTDVIAGFPGETEKDFLETVSVLREAKPDVVNISRFGARPGTLAASMQGQLHGRIKKKRSRELSILCRKIGLERNRLLLGSVQRILVSEKGKGKTLVGRTQNYRPVAVRKGLFGKFAEVEIKKAFPTYVSPGGF